MHLFPPGHIVLNTPVVWKRNALREGYVSLLFRRDVALPKAVAGSLWITASQRFILYVDGLLVARGPARGDPNRWNVSRVPLELAAGRHCLCAQVIHFGPHAGKGQLGGPGFFLVASEQPELRALLATGDAWLVRQDNSRSPQTDTAGSMRGHFAVGAAELFDSAAFPYGWNAVDYDASRWEPAQAVFRGAGNPWGNRSIGHMLRPAPIDPIADDPAQTPTLRHSSLIIHTAGGQGDPLPLTIPAQTSGATLVFDAGALQNAYPELTFAGGRGAMARVIYCEAPRDPDTGEKGNRDVIEGKSFPGQMDIIRASGAKGQRFQPLWFRSFRYICLEVSTGDDPLVIEGLTYKPTGYPLPAPAAMPATATPADGLPWERLLEITHRTARLCSHETLFDCPQYEQAQFPGDARILARYHYRIADDDRLIRKAIDDLHASRTVYGLLQSHYPSTFYQILPTYSLQWIGMLREFLEARGDAGFLRPYLPAAREILDWFESQRKAHALLRRLPFPPFVDWCPAFDCGRAPEESEGDSSIVAAMLCGAARDMAQLEHACGYPELAARWQTLADSLKEAVRERCYSHQTGLMADTAAWASFSVHAQVEACLGGILTPAEAARAIGQTWQNNEHAQPGTFYYMAFLMDALIVTGLRGRLPELLEPFLALLHETGLTTWPESIRRDTRSDCHGWSILPGLLAVEQGWLK